ncbi:stage II sporulation protein D [[Clostridium] colinum]|uniref:stage II sporulation protein D n=1 Tax=[Clostridium] colinum TaxID=36835 RepID=UPI002023D34B|nr:stage II sporulation protein D [[Clostridium] colinum]
MFKGIFIFITYILSIAVFIPSFTVYFFKNNEGLYEIKAKDKIDVIDNVEVLQDGNKVNNQENITTNNIKPQNNIFEDYILGVVAAEMPISFEEEALKAQAVAARTYAYKRIDDINKPVDHNSIGQAYNSIEQMKNKWGSNFDNYYNKVKNAVYETEGIIMMYENEPIEAVFHSTSAGITEVSENIWGKNLPYIKSVDSKVDEKAPNFIYTTSIPNSQIIDTLSKKYSNLDKNKIISSFDITKRSEADYVLEVTVCGKKISGRDIRTMFGLRSTNFTIEKTKDSINFTTKGYGHGAGMSQYGANFMAQDGSSYEEILLHYYDGITLQKVY